MVQARKGSCGFSPAIRAECTNADLSVLFVKRELKLATNVEVERTRQGNGKTDLSDRREGARAVPSKVSLCHGPA